MLSQPSPCPRWYSNSKLTRAKGSVWTWTSEISCTGLSSAGYRIRSKKGAMIQQPLLPESLPPFWDCSASMSPPSFTLPHQTHHLICTSRSTMILWHVGEGSGLSIGTPGEYNYEYCWKGFYNCMRQSLPQMAFLGWILERSLDRGWE